MVDVEIMGCVVTAQYGTLKSGDILRTDNNFAQHLVNDCKAAKYVVHTEKTESENNQAIFLPVLTEPQKSKK